MGNCFTLTQLLERAQGWKVLCFRCPDSRIFMENVIRLAPPPQGNLVLVAEPISEASLERILRGRDGAASLPEVHTCQISHDVVDGQRVSMRHDSLHPFENGRTDGYGESVAIDMEGVKEKGADITAIRGDNVNHSVERATTLANDLVAGWNWPEFRDQCFVLADDAMDGPVEVDKYKDGEEEHLFWG
ncbi:uncharacterized protein BCR38DRAFT_487685 [Pseudomassariella vexata]|uniref:Uncharacterized protein n=1 Tax=Pseudomassariella vexata TaxID=1141098 RepID=A0A1Y2DMV9_9PEZI|nr:uncharacterized protein BCR38DRAFT_487685 [Pseudomassariella vexata]ORY60628.1 hypothetical protein BCR38DRAFT_487685 [Pseudomassariella vexata]